ncbi:hypothetical protein [Mesorhizobium sp. RMAD-H1]|uniref:hypothetical protein n=1 Tax=Mesorhizobium sp. RMAD-H1 TaxID=2587065 RepID=UPI00160ACDC2|nr:hypothetical protein [Mesorhizobium sp. RMAD-H1]MBB2973975.1 hypothetical protein [Mesorhizobium sp. RMAD-H1]
MNLDRTIKYMIVDGDAGVICWRRPFSRYGCERSRRVLARFPDRADAFARATIEAGSRKRTGKAVRHG